MSSTGSSTLTPTLMIDARSRRTETWVAILTVLAAALSSALLHLSPATAAVTAIAMAGVIAVGFGRSGWLGGENRIETVSWVADGRWFLGDRRGRSFEVALEGGTRAACGAVWLRWSNAHGRRPRYSMLLAPGDLPSEDLRRLIVRLRIEGSRAASSPGVVAA